MTKAKKPEQLKIAGTERKDRVPAIDDLAEQYRELRDQRMAIAQEENELQQQLLDLMKTRGLEKYVYEDKGGDLEEVFLVTDDVKVKVRKVKPSKGDA